MHSTCIVYGNGLPYFINYLNEMISLNQNQNILNTDEYSVPYSSMELF
jgi:hypothetical protein